jgi:hypothetical protein
MEIIVCFLNQGCLLAARACELPMWYMPMHIEELIACVVFLCENICMFYKTSYLADNHFQFLEVGDNSVLWLSFAQQKQFKSLTLGTYFFDLKRQSRHKPKQKGPKQPLSLPVLLFMAPIFMKLRQICFKYVQVYLID